MEDNVKNILILIVIIIVVRWATVNFVPMLHGLIDPLCTIAIIWGLWVFVFRPLFRK